jgi:pSer/pThr/pTyr-binding forkhead associated (FHA) protein
MATETPTSPTTRLEQRETAALEPALATRGDSLSALDHRSRRRAIRRDLALPGHYLALEAADGSEHLLPLDGKVVHLGRAGTADVRIEDPRVSRRHAIVVRYGRHVRVLDDRSSAGTFVNGARIIATDLADGDVIRLGPLTFTYVIVR